MDQTYLGLYAQDTWRADRPRDGQRGLRWEPFFGQNVQNGAISNFSLDNFRQGVKSTVFLNAPAGLIYPGDAGFPGRQVGHEQAVEEPLAARRRWRGTCTATAALAVRSSYGLGYDFPSGAVSLHQRRRRRRSATACASSGRAVRRSVSRHTRRRPASRFRSRTPTRRIPAFGAFGTIDPDINSPRVQSWNVTRRAADRRDWQASASYLGSYIGSPVGPGGAQPGRVPRARPCTIAGVSYPVVHDGGEPGSAARALRCENPAEAQFLGPVDRHTDVGTQDYAALKLSFRRRAGDRREPQRQLHAVALRRQRRRRRGFPQISAGYLKPDDPDFDRGNCAQNRTHIANVTAGVPDAGVRQRGAARRSRRTGACRASSARARAAGSP